MLRSEVALRQSRGVRAVRGEAVGTEADHRGDGGNQGKESKDRSCYDACRERMAPTPSLRAWRDLGETNWIDPRQLHHRILTHRTDAPILARS